MICLYSYILITFIILLYISKTDRSMRKMLISRIPKYGGMCNKIASLPGVYILSQLANKKYHSI